MFVAYTFGITEKRSTLFYKQYPLRHLKISAIPII